MTRVGVPQSDYNAVRNIVGSIPNGMTRVRPWDRCRLQTALGYRLGRKLPERTWFSFTEPYLPRVDILHLFNSVADVNVPWITTFEEVFPRWAGESDDQMRRGLGLALDDRCKRLIAMSDAARNEVEQDWARLLGPTGAGRLMSKLEVLLPPQRIIREQADGWRNPEPLLAFVGRDFYRKGGLELLKALDRLRSAGISSWRAIVVGGLGTFGDYASQTDAASRAEAEELLGRLASHVMHHEWLDPQGVLQLMERSDILLLPTWADTFGYVVLEGMAFGAIPLVSNVRALPEIVDEGAGYIVRVPLDAKRDAHRLGTLAGTKPSLEKQLARVLEEAFSLTDPEVRDRRARGFEALRRRHCPKAHRARLSDLYRSALA